MEGGKGVSCAACVGCLGCYWVKEAGDSRVPLPAAQRALSSLSIKVKSSAPLPPPRSGPVAVAADRSRNFRKAQMYNWRGHHSCCKSPGNRDDPDYVLVPEERDLPQPRRLQNRPRPTRGKREHLQA
ncbi:Hypothetical predicted protein [Marmota monax]|uniref:Uncharacterized protein n=1 Tax=Marmota monax TaxID=9995 RepID=A0A5E4D574_MARMO|nr:hypothetical protein GHT09_017116 [Marmota monax]VTJ88392.1 Hypothetical predicted protein [Marmota monax]